jgi:hypothetical protein
MRSRFRNKQFWLKMRHNATVGMRKRVRMHMHSPSGAITALSQHSPYALAVGAAPTCSHQSRQQHSSSACTATPYMTQLPSANPHPPAIRRLLLDPPAARDTKQVAQDTPKQTCKHHPASKSASRHCQYICFAERLPRSHQDRRQHQLLNIRVLAAEASHMHRTRALHIFRLLFLMHRLDIQAQRST